MKLILFAFVASVVRLQSSTAYKSANLQAYKDLKRSFLRPSNKLERQRTLQGIADLASTPATASSPSGAPILRPPAYTLPVIPSRKLSRKTFRRHFRPINSRRRQTTCRNDLTRHTRHHLCEDARECGFPNNDLDVLFVLDRSGSVGPCDFQKELQFVKALVCQLDGYLTRVGIVSFASRTRVDVPLCRHQNSCALANQVRRVRYHGGSTATACALNMVNAIFDETDQSFRRCFMSQTIAPEVAISGSGDQMNVSADQVNEAPTRSGTITPRQDLPPSKRVFVITDGKSNTGGNPAVPARKLHRRGAEVFALGVTRSVNRRELQEIASPDRCSPPCRAYVMPNWMPGDPCPKECVEKHVFYLDDFNDFTELAQLFSNDPTSQGRCSQCGHPSTPVINGGWSEWSEWFKCPVPDMRRCGRRQKLYHYRSRQCDSPSRSVCGQPCKGNNIEQKLCFNKFVKCPDGPICPPHKPAVKCRSDPCAGYTCDAFPEAKCTTNYCGECSAVFKIDGMEVPCTGPKRLCDNIYCGMGRVCVERTVGVPECCPYNGYHGSIIVPHRPSFGGISRLFPKIPRKCAPVRRTNRLLPGQRPNFSLP